VPPIIACTVSIIARANSAVNICAQDPTRHTSRVRLCYGERLRRARATTEARAQLTAALEIFERLGARPWIFSETWRHLSGGAA